MSLNKNKKSQFQSQEAIFESELNHAWPKTSSREWTKKTSSTEIEKWRHARNSIEYAVTSE